MITRIKGTQDLLDLTLFNFLIDQAKKHLTLYNFTEIATPILEPIEVFKRSLGLETDVVTKEMYTVNTGKDEESICLRPEATASVVRAFVNNTIQDTPWKVFLWGSMFRHERPQKGRYREFHQINMEIIGSASIDQDVQLLKMLDRFFHEVLKLDTYGLLINFLGCSEDRAQYRKELYKFLEKVAPEICPTCQIRKEKNIMRVFDCKSPSCQALFKDAPHIADHLCTKCQKEWTDLKNNLEHLSVSYSYSPTLVRGLDYYEKTVFEFVSTELGAQNAFCGGGRYHQLVSIVGGKEDQPSVGAAIGIERILLMLERIKDKLVLPQLPALHLIVPLTPEQHALALLLADELQAKKFCTDILLDGGSVKSLMRKANKMAAKYVILIGSEEQAQKIVTVKNMVTGTEEKIAQRDLASSLLS
jgi:histidyl-tRNA synthetase